MSGFGTYVSGDTSLMSRDIAGFRRCSLSKDSPSTRRCRANPARAGLFVVRSQPGEPRSRGGMRNGDISGVSHPTSGEKPSAADRRSRRLCPAHKVPGFATVSAESRSRACSPLSWFVPAAPSPHAERTEASRCGVNRTHSASLEASVRVGMWRGPPARGERSAGADVILAQQEVLDREIREGQQRRVRTSWWNTSTDRRPLCASSFVPRAPIHRSAS